MAGKHGPNRFAVYESIHETVMARFQAEGFVLSHNLTFEDVGADTLFLGGPDFGRGEIVCAWGIRIDVEKYLRVLSGDGRNALVQTYRYSYNASLAGYGNIIRYCSPHATDGDPPDQPAHHFAHHRHVFDVFNGDRDGRVEVVPNEEARPTLGDVLTELRDWASEHSEALANLAR